MPLEDFSVYCRGRFDPQALRDIGWPGEVFEVGGWSAGVFNGGAWLEIDGRKSDVHYRDLDTVDREIAASREGQFDIEPLMFHLAGVPSYLLLAELAVKHVLHGRLPAPKYPAALRERAPRVWWGRAERTFDYARANHAPYGRLTQCAGPHRAGDVAGGARGTGRARPVDHQVICALCALCRRYLL